ncbi:hypothetical protein C2U72_26080 [Prosthecomicrobium hirschii]|uniref:BLUF domain-containing protein n=1 Tax=Prosthecodimorpha hirschii TaxID=665126 RepID=UPI00112C5E73|nr:BLUF domain-containing protein [Prosthecomicrobium hirschii]TPQ46052.1 hypothetical protein C2U72_26080 [Prosthecomicrobium hirschii]
MYLARVNFYTRCSLKGTAANWVKEILLSCTTYDNASGLSGALLFNERYFLQSMEGERSLLTNQIIKIAEDQRQSGLTVVSFTPIASRIYPGWTVAYAGHNDAMDSLYFRHSVIGELDPIRMTREMIEGLMGELCGMEGANIQRSSPNGRIRSPERPRPNFSI